MKKLILVVTLILMLGLVSCSVQGISWSSPLHTTTTEQTTIAQKENSITLTGEDYKAYKRFMNESDCTSMAQLYDALDTWIDAMFASNTFIEPNSSNFCAYWSNQ